MIGTPPRRRGQPLFVLGAIMLSWIGARAALWQPDHGSAPLPPVPANLFAVAGGPGSAVPLAAAPGAVSSTGLLRAGPVVQPSAIRVPSVRSAVLPQAIAAELPVTSSIPLESPPTSPIAPGLAGGHAMMWLAVVGQMPLPTALLAAAAARPTAPVPALQRQPVPAARRWSADAWAFFRDGGGAASLGPSVATYGASQAGAVLRYRLMPDNPNRPTAYLRASAALGGSGEREAAVGLSARPIAGIPVVVAVEGRLGRLGGRTVTRPALMAITEVAPFALPRQARGEFYLQGGYVGGVGASPFVDGQLKVDRQVARVGPVELRAGAGVWGGAQRGAGRLDVGPSATLGIAQGQAATRVGLDWRFRIKGEAQPSSGPALTISAGF